MSVSGWRVMWTKLRTIVVVVLIAATFGTLLGNAETLYAAETPETDTSEEQTAEEMLAAEAALQAQEAQAAGATAEPGSETTNPLDDNAPEAAASSSPGADDEDFVPTIQISEDLSVSFPVDI
jgi:hypothetical protein